MVWLSRLLIGIVGFILAAISGSMAATLINGQQADMYLSPDSGRFAVGDTFVVNVRVESAVPVNVFAGMIRFNHTYLEVQTIDYNVSAADLWAVEPWYENGAGTLQFAGGTTRSNGFLGDAQLLQVTFVAKAKGQTALELFDASILKHNGLGTEISLTDRPIDALFELEQEEYGDSVVFWREWAGGMVAIEPELLSTDLNNDGKQSITDVSIFMLLLAQQDSRADFNQDGVINTKDLSIILNSW